jgi:Protein of unknown function, DUF481.
MRSLLLLCGLLLPHLALADVLWLGNGDRLTGEVRALNAQKLTFASKLAGEVTVAWTDVQKLESDKPLLLEFKPVTGNPDGKDELVEVVMQGQLHYFPRHIVTEIAQPEHFSGQLLWTGNLDMSLDLKRESSNTNEIRLKTDQEIQKGYWRDQFKASLDHSRQDGVLNNYDYELTNDLDYFWSSHWFWRGETVFKHDFLEELNEEVRLGSGPGYRFYEDKSGRFEVGSLYGRYVYRYRSAPDINFRILGINWDYRHNFQASKLEFYTDGEYGYPFFEEMDYALEAEAGLRYNLSESLRLTLSTELESLQGELESHNDWRHFLGIGYSWE